MCVRERNMVERVWFVLSTPCRRMHLDCGGNTCKFFYVGVCVSVAGAVCFAVVWCVRASSVRCRVSPSTVRTCSLKDNFETSSRGLCRHLSLLHASRAHTIVAVND